MHELGHAMGFDHPHGDSAIGDHFGNLPTEWDSMEFTVMTYRSYVGAPAGPYSNEQWSYAQSLMMLDIAALQYLYGADYTDQTNTVYSWSPITGVMSINGVAENPATAPGGNRIFRTILDGGGVDTYDFSNYMTDLHVDLNPGGWTTTSQ